MTTRAIYPGSFDPVTNGHVDIANRAARLFDELVVAVYDAPPKNLLFTTQERIALFRQAVQHLPNVKVIPYTGLTVALAHRLGTHVVIRGLRMGSDFEREFEMALMNRQIDSHIETVALMSSLEYQFLSASLMKEVCELGGDVSRLVPPHVLTALQRKQKLQLPIRAKKGGPKSKR